MPYSGHPFAVTAHSKLMRQLKGRTDITSSTLFEVAHEAARQISRKTQSPRIDKDYNMNVTSNGCEYWLAWEFLSPIEPDGKTMLVVKQIKKCR